MSRSLNASRDPNAPWYHLDPLVALAALALAGLGIASIYSSTRGTDPLDYNTFYLERQTMFVVIGIGMGTVAALVDYQRLRMLSPFLYALSIGLLIAVLSPLGSEVNGAQAWFNFAGFGIQPSEFAKLAVIVMLANYLSRSDGDLNLRQLAVALTIPMFPMLLILQQPDVGTILVFIAIIMGMLWIGGARLSHISLMTVTGIALLVAVFNSPLLADYQRDRLTVVYDGDITDAGAGFNQGQAQIAIGNGGFSGKGYGMGDQTRSGLVPEQETDFIFTVIGEELGFIGSMLVLGLFGILIWRIWRAAQLAKDSFGTLICVGILSMIIFQMFQSIGMTAGMMPVTGIPLPFISFGGSSSLVSFIAIGLVMNVRMRRWQ